MIALKVQRHAKTRPARVLGASSKKALIIAHLRVRSARLVVVSTTARIGVRTFAWHSCSYEGGIVSW